MKYKPIFSHVKQTDNVMAKNPKNFQKIKTIISGYHIEFSCINENDANKLQHQKASKTCKSENKMFNFI